MTQSLGIKIWNFVVALPKLCPSGKFCNQSPNPGPPQLTAPTTVWTGKALHQFLFQIQNLAWERPCCQVRAWWVSPCHLQAREASWGYSQGFPRAVSVHSPVWWLLMMLCSAFWGQHKQITSSPLKKTNNFIIYSLQGKGQALTLLPLVTQFALPHLPHPCSQVETDLPISLSCPTQPGYEDD